MEPPVPTPHFLSIFKVRETVQDFFVYRNLQFGLGLPTIGIYGSLTGGAGNALINCTLGDFTGVEPVNNSAPFPNDLLCGCEIILSFFLNNCFIELGT